MLGVEFPICAFSHCRDVVAAVSNAGGFGVLGAVAHSPERLETELSWIEEHTGGKPYGVDLLLPPKYVGADRGGIDSRQVGELLPEEHRQFVDDLLSRYGIPASTAEQRQPSGGLNISPKGYEPLLDVVFDHRVRLIASALGSPPAELVTRAHDNDVLVAAGAETTAGQILDSGWLWGGRPARPLKRLDAARRAMMAETVRHYVDYGHAYRAAQIAAAGRG